MSSKPLDLISENRRNNLERLIEKNYRNINDFCVSNNEDYSAVHRYLSGALKIGNNVVKRFESIFNLKKGEFDKSSALYEIIQIPIYLSTGSFTSIKNILDRQPQHFAHIEGLIFSSMGVDKNHAIGITYDNDSMFPNIKKGWSVLVDTSKKEIEDGQTYAILLNNKIQFRNLFFGETPDFLVLKPINAIFNELKVKTSDCQIIGKPAYILGGSYDK